MVGGADEAPVGEKEPLDGEPWISVRTLRALKREEGRSLSETQLEVRSGSPQPGTSKSADEERMRPKPTVRSVEKTNLAALLKRRREAKEKEGVPIVVSLSTDEPPTPSPVGEESSICWETAGDTEGQARTPGPGVPTIVLDDEVPGPSGTVEPPMEEDTWAPRRKRGRPRGSRNKPKGETSSVASSDLPTGSEAVEGSAELHDSGSGADPSPDRMKKIVRQKKRPRRVLGSSDEEEEDATPIPLSAHQWQRVEGEVATMSGLSTATLANRAIGWLRDADAARKKSPNIQGGLTRQIKLNIFKAQEVIRRIGARAKESGDVAFLRKRIIDLERERENMRGELVELRGEVASLREAMRLRPPSPARTTSGVPFAPSPPSPSWGKAGSARTSVGARDRASKGGRIATVNPPPPVQEAQGDGCTDSMSIFAKEFVSLLGKLYLPTDEEIRRCLPGKANTEGSIRDSSRDRRGRRATVTSGTETDRPWTKVVGRRLAKRVQDLKKDQLVAGNSPGPSSTPGTSRQRRRQQSGQQQQLQQQQQGGQQRQLHQQQQQGPETKKAKQVSGDRDRAPIPPPLKGRRDGNTQRQPRRRPARTAAVAITCREGGSVSYADAMKRAKECIPLGPLGIKDMGLRKGVTGSLLLEIPGDQMADKADQLADRLREVFVGSNDVWISRPTRRAELRLFGLDASITLEEVRSAVMEHGVCRAVDIKLGQIRPMRAGLGSLWVQCPLQTANKLADLGKIGIGWSRVGVELLKRRALQCFKCLAPGHTQQRCPNAENRRDLCYNCGGEGHRVSGCRESPRCPVCADKGLPAKHRAGGAGCPPCPPRTSGPKLAPGPSLEPGGGNSPKAGRWMEFS